MTLEVKKELRKWLRLYTSFKILLLELPSPELLLQQLEREIEEQEKTKEKIISLPSGKVRCPLSSHADE